MKVSLSGCPLRAAVIALACCSAWPALRAQNCDAFEVTMVLPGDLEQADQYGASAAMNGDVLVVGAPFENFRVGAAYVFRWSGSAWVEEQKLIASDGYNLQDFGQSVAVNGGVVVVGSAGQNCDEAAYVYRFDGAQWNEEQKLTPSVASFCNSFGCSVAVSGNVVVVGAEEDDIPNTTKAGGSAFVYRFNGAQWLEEQKLRSNNLVADDLFGHSVAVDGNRAVIGATRQMFHPTFYQPGTVYSFLKTPAGWVQEQELGASDGHSSNGFGFSLALEGTTLAVGAPATYERGAVYVYTHDGSAWSGEKKTSAIDGVPSNALGTYVALSGQALVAGAPLDDEQGTEAGAAYLFVELGGTWAQSHKLLAVDGENGYHLGSAVAVDGDKIVVGADRFGLIGSHSGAAFVYDRMQLPNCPLAYCTGKLSSAGCVPHIGSTGVPSATTGSFLVKAARVVNRKSGMLVYGLAPAATPFQGGVLCIAPPVKRTFSLYSNGLGSHVHDCSGSFLLDFNHWIHFAGDPSLVAGASVYAQFVFRDPQDPFGIGLSNALSFVINP